MWDLPGPGLKPVSPALAGGFLTTAPAGKPTFGILVSKVFSIEIAVTSRHWNNVKRGVEDSVMGLVREGNNLEYSCWDQKWASMFDYIHN